ncbi:hypothetical protein ACQ4PT_002059 [Festuca glaucescens]
MEALLQPEEAVALVKLWVAARKMKRQIPPEEHWTFCYDMLQKVSRSFAFVIQQLGPDLRNAVCIFYLVLRAMDTVEDDTSIPTEEKLPILRDFYRHAYDPNWRYSCGTNHFKVLMDKFRYVSTAFLELDQGYQKPIEEITRLMGAGMAKFICQEVETIDDYDEYCHYVSGLVGYGLSRLFHAAGTEDLALDQLSNSMGLFLQKNSIIRDYLEDINEIPKCRMFWPREIWSKYVEKLEVTAIGTFAIFYNNVNIFRGAVKMRRGLTARIIDETRSMKDVYSAFYEFSSLLESKINDNDPTAALTRKRVDAIKKTCKSSGLLKRRGYDLEKSKYRSMLIMLGLLLVAIILGVLTPSDSVNMVLVYSV